MVMALVASLDAERALQQQEDAVLLLLSDHLQVLEQAVASTTTQDGPTCDEQQFRDSIKIITEMKGLLEQKNVDISDLEQETEGLQHDLAVLKDKLKEARRKLEKRCRKR